MSVSDEQLYSYLHESGTLPRATIVLAREYARTHEVTLKDALLQQGHLHVDEVRRVVAQCLGIPFVTLDTKHIDPEVLVLLPEAFSRAHSMVAYALSEEGLEVAVLESEGVLLLEEYAANIRYKILPRMTDAPSMTRALIQYQKVLKERHGTAIQYAVRDGLSEPLVEGIVLHALASGATEAHLEPRERGVLVRYRVGGKLLDAMTIPARSYPGVQSRLKSLAKLLPHDPKPQMGRFKVGRLESPLDVVSCHITTLPTISGEHILLSIAPHYMGRRGMTLQSLGLHGVHIEEIQRMLARPSGIVVVAGGTYTDVSSVLYTLLDIVIRPERRVVVIEETAGVRFPGVTHVELRPSLGLTYATAIRAALTKPLDVLLVDRITDTHVAELLVSAANRGVLVLVGLLAQNTLQALSVLVRYDIPATRLAATLRLIIAVAPISPLGAVGIPRTLTYEEVERIEPLADFGRVLNLLRTENILPAHIAWKDVQFADGEVLSGSTQHVFEVVPMTQELQMLIQQDADIQQILRVIRSDATTLVEDALFRAAQGGTTISEVLRVAEEYVK